MTDEEFKALHVQAESTELDPADVTGTIDPTEDADESN